MPSIRRLAPPFVATIVAFASPGAAAQGLPVGASVANASVTAWSQLDADIDGGGETRGYGAFAIGSLTRRFTPEVTAGVTLRYDQENWRWSGDNAFGGAPFGRIHRPGIAGTFVYAAGNGVAWTVLPSIQWAYASGASTGDAQNWGAVFAVSKNFSPDLTLGLGASVFREIGKNEAFPVLLVDWRLNDRLRLRNPSQAGPAGGAGLELVWTHDERWEFAAGGAWRHYRFRLDRDGSVPDGVGEKNAIPLLARATWRPTPATAVDLHAGAAVAGEITLYDRDNNEVVSRDFDPAPIFGISLQMRF